MANPGTEVAPANRPPSPISNLNALLKRAEPQIKMALPRHMTPERMLRVALTAAQRTPDLLKCDPLSFVGAVVQASQLGLEPDGALGHAYLVPFNNRKTGRMEVQLIAGYRGLIDLARRSGSVNAISAHVVYEKDEFSFVYGLEEKLEHKPYMGKDRGVAVCVYAIARLKDGGYAFDVMPVSEVEKIRNKSKAGNSGPWQDHWDEMARKTVIRRLCKYLPLSPEIHRAIGLDEMADAGVAQSLDIDVETNEAVADATRMRLQDLKDRHTPNSGNGNDAGDDEPHPADVDDARE
jgi:recombination protein RecT